MHRHGNLLYFFLGYLADQKDPFIGVVNMLEACVDKIYSNFAPFALSRLFGQFHFFQNILLA